MRVPITIFLQSRAKVLYGRGAILTCISASVERLKETVELNHTHLSDFPDHRHVQLYAPPSHACQVAI